MEKRCCLCRHFVSRYKYCKRDISKPQEVMGKKLSKESAGCPIFLGNTLAIGIYRNYGWWTFLQNCEEFKPKGKGCVDGNGMVGR